MVEIWENEVVGRNSGRAIFRCPVSGVSAPTGGNTKSALFFYLKSFQIEHTRLQQINEKK